MLPRLDIEFPIKRQIQYWCGKPYVANEDCRLKIEECKIQDSSIEDRRLKIEECKIQDSSIEDRRLKIEECRIQGEYLVNHARTGIVMALRAALPNGGRVGVVAYNCHTVANAVVNAECTPVFVDVTEELRIDVESVPRDLDAIVVTNLFGIRNDVEAIRKRCPGAVVIVDNAHGYGLPVEGDFTVYSINQGKFPALGEGGILIVSQKLPTIDQKLFEGTKTQINTVPEINKKIIVKIQKIFLL